MKIKYSTPRLVLALFAGAIFAGMIAGCGTTLQPGGAYSGSTLATNTTTGAVSTNVASAPDLEFELADSAYKLAYDTIDGVLSFELNNRAQLLATFPGFKAALDKLRPTLVKIDQRWAAARQAYKRTPTPAGLTTIQSILAEIQKLVPTAQAAMAPVLTSTTTNSVSP
jgi:hypothetical protein